MRFRTEHACLLLAGVLALTLFVGGRSENAEIRHATGTVVEVGAETIIRTEDGHEWVWGNCGYDRGTYVSVDFDTQGTEELEDDIIIKVQKITVGSGMKKHTPVDHRYQVRR